MELKLGRPVVLLLVVGLAFAMILVHSQDQSGFISIDCGLSKDNYTDEKTFLYYVSDEGFIETGIVMDISSVYQSGSLAKQLINVRTFPQGIKNCYTLRPAQGKGTNYLVRATFMYGNYDSKNMPPKFDLQLGTDVWDTVKLDNASQVVVKEMIYTPSVDYLYVCLANIGLGTPFISLLELRHLNSSIYNRVSGSLELISRFYTYTTSTNKIRYKDDIFDRIWEAVYLVGGTTISTKFDVDSSSDEFRLPSAAMKAAMTMINHNDSIVISFESDNFTSQYYFYFHFAEVEILGTNEIREFNILLNGNLYFRPFAPPYLDSFTIYNAEPLSGTVLTFRFQKTTRSTLPPIINALEYFMVKELFQALTNQQDGDAIFEIKSVYSISKNWQGDPCIPQSYMWDGLNCSFTNLNSPVIIALNLSSSGLTGNIAPPFSDLTSLQVLDLSNNGLTGQIPESLAGLPSLRILNLSANKLTGSVPRSLLEKSEKGQLILSLGGNPYLCPSLSCIARNKKSFVIPVVASVAAFVGLVVVLGILLLIKTRKPAIETQPLPQPLPQSPPQPLPQYPPQPPYQRNKSGLTQFSYSEVNDMTEGFKKKLGKGAFGTVYYGYLKDGTKVAVKRLHSGVHALEQFGTEVNLLMKIRHKNLVCLLGFCDEGDNLLLIYEYIANGNLQSILSAKDAPTWTQRLQIAIGAAEGLDYLHRGCRPSIVHRDVKTPNILLDEKFEAKVADFGVSKLFPDDYHSRVFTRVIGTPGYLDPEYLMTQQLNEKSDVYSFGVVLLELVTGQQAVTERLTAQRSLIDKVRPFLERWDIGSIVDPRMKESIQNQNSVSRLIEVAMSCVERSSNARPKMGFVVTELSECLAMEMRSATTSQGSYTSTTGTFDSLEMSSALPVSAMNPRAR